MTRMKRECGWCWVAKIVEPKHWNYVPHCSSGQRIELFLSDKFVLANLSYSVLQKNLKSDKAMTSVASSE